MNLALIDQCGTGPVGQRVDGTGYDTNRGYCAPIHDVNQLCLVGQGGDKDVYYSQEDHRSKLYSASIATV